ncbi:MAG: hypothetical protein AAF755_13955 [Pseudomonadota bacterium]
MARSRSPGYPNTSLKDCIDNAKKIYKGDYTNPMPREVAARHMGYAGTTGTSDRAISALMHFGLLEKVSKGEVKITQLAMDILFPESAAGRYGAVKSAANRPALFSRISKKFPEVQPSEQSLTNFLSREGFVAAAIDPAMKSYLETQQFLQQERVSESYSNADHPRAESAHQERKDEILQVPASSPAPQATTAQLYTPIETELNTINAEIRGDQVYVSALMDKDGLQRLKRKIAALEDFLADD